MKKKVLHFKRKPKRWKQGIVSHAVYKEVGTAILVILAALFISFCFIYMIQTSPY